MNKIILLLLLSVNFLYAQNPWKKIELENYKSKIELQFSKTNPKTFDLYSLNTESFKNEVSSLRIISIPINGNLANFSIKESSTFSKPLALKYGYIKSFSLKGIDDKTATGKISIGVDGVHIIIFSGKHSTIYIAPYTKDKNTYITYSKDQIENKENDFQCLLDESYNVKKANSKLQHKNANDGKLRTYRLALTCTGEYAQFHIQNQGISNTATDAVKKAAVLSAMNTTMTRINGIFERDLSTKMSIVLNSSGENELVFLDSETDNLSNGEAFTLLDENQELCDNIIGTNNYDIGHVFSISSNPGGDGLAALGVLCSNQKAKGVTGNQSPIGDTYDIDFVAHEIGHQFGANHTFNNSCSSNRWTQTAVEPGSGTTIMGYAGICSPDIQSNSDDYFHAVSINEMWSIIENTSCATETNTNNTAPIVNAGNDVSVPKSTPLILKGQATDSDSNSLTYCWEQLDTEIATMPPLSTNEAGPLFRSLPPSSDPNRYLPALSTVVSGNTSTEWEVTPSVAREINFSLLVRDNNENGGASERDDIKINTIDTDPFTVTIPNTNITWNVGATVAITWDKSTTDLAPINCQNVKITLSTDGGETFPIILAESTPNDGIHNFIVPNQLTTSARIMISAVDNIFYNVNTTDFTIASTGPTFVLSNTSLVQETCNDTSSSVTYEINIDFINDFSEAVNLTLDDIPTGTTATLSNTSITDDSTVTLTITNFENVTAGDYTIKINGESSSLNSILELPTLKVNVNTFTAITLSSPLNNQTNISVQELDLTWNNTDTNTSLFDLEIATDLNFNTIVISEENITTNGFTLTEFLNWNTTYYWRVKPKNSCGEGGFSSTFTFTTTEEAYCSSNFDNIDEYITNVTFGSINNNSGDANEDEANGFAGYQNFTSISTNLIIGVTYTLSVSLNPVGYQDHCYVFIDWNNDSIFNTTNERYDLGTHEQTNDSTGTLDITIPDDATLGETRMRVIIEYYDTTFTYGSGPCNSDHNWEYGETEDYSVNITDSQPTNNNNVFENFSIFPNPVEDSINVLFDVPYTKENVNISLFDFTGKLVKSETYQDNNEFFTKNLPLNYLQSGVYLLKVTNSIIYTTQKIIVE